MPGVGELVLRRLGVATVLVDDVATVVPVAVCCCTDGGGNGVALNNEVPDDPVGGTPKCVPGGAGYAELYNAGGGGRNDAVAVFGEGVVNGIASDDEGCGGEGVGCVEKNSNVGSYSAYEGLVSTMGGNGGGGAAAAATVGGAGLAKRFEG